MRRALNAQGWGICYLCGQAFTASLLEVDHKVPLHKGGRDEGFNLAPACHPCHRAKTVKERLGS